MDDDTVHNIDLTNKSYKEVDLYVRSLANVSENICWDDLNSRALRNIVPKNKSNDFYEAIKYSYEVNDRTCDYNEHYKYFRNSYFLNEYFPWDENIYMYVTKNNIRVFLVCAYHERLFEQTKTLFKKIGKCFSQCQVDYYNIIKDLHYEGERSRAYPFKRNYLNLMIVSKI
jgi:hypothetical protein